MNLENEILYIKNKEYIYVLTKNSDNYNELDISIFEIEEWTNLTKISKVFEGYVFNLDTTEYINLENNFSNEYLGESIEYTTDEISAFTTDIADIISCASMKLMNSEKLKYFKPGIFSLIPDEVIFYTNPSIFRLELWPEALSNIIKSKSWYNYLLRLVGMEITKQAPKSLARTIRTISKKTL